IGFDAFPLRLAEALEEIRLSRFPERRAAREALTSLRAELHRLAALPAFRTEPHPAGFLQRSEVAAERRTIHGQALRELGDRLGIPRVDRGENRKLRGVDTRRTQRFVVRSRHESRRSSDARTRACVDEVP